MEQKLLEEAHILLHPIRYRIVELLSQGPIHINAISSTLKVERRLVTYHLDTLEQAGFVTSKYEMSQNPRSKGKAIRKYWLTGKDAEVIAKVKEQL